MSRAGDLAAPALALVLAACAAPPPGGGAPAAPGKPAVLRNGDFEAEPVPGRACPADWSCSMHADPLSFAFAVERADDGHGRRLVVTRLKPEPWAIVTQYHLAAGLEGRLRLSVSVDARQLEGAAGASVTVHDIAGRVSVHRQALVKPGPGWQPVAVEIAVPAGSHSVEFGLLVEGGGRVAFDDAAVERLPPGP